MRLGALRVSAGCCQERNVRGRCSAYFIFGAHILSLRVLRNLILTNIAKVLIYSYLAESENSLSKPGKAKAN